MKKGLYSPYEGPYEIDDLIEIVFRILRLGIGVTVSVDRLNPAYVPKELVDTPAGVHRKEKVSSQPEEVLDLVQKKPARSSSRQENHNTFRP
ncbi:hypothetical protein NPIL_318131 [Nephila pilipes]|uniref:Uncharacterized protein n=1 Tax=Nephila pilipes TaxID=299642 RepID=A0A8X6NN12_NEPPI|nr:hypothetical protein NPIL_318131 [Nephila pilipes]